MYVDAITLAAVADEWRRLLKNARIDTIIQPSEYAIALQCYAPNMKGEGGQNRWLYLSAHPQMARVHITALKPPKSASEPPPFVMLLRKYLEGTRIEAIQQPRWERVIEIISSHRVSPESEERVRYRLIIEIMGRRSNIIFCDEQGMILGSLRRIGSDVNRYRVIAPNVPYVPPPPQQRTFAGQSLPKLEPTTITAAQLSMCAADAAEMDTSGNPGNDTKRVEADLSRPGVGSGNAGDIPRRPTPGRDKSASTQFPRYWQLLTRNLLGFSALIAREAVFRTTGDSDSLVEHREEVWEELAWNVRELAALYDSHAWHPELAERVEHDADRSLPIAEAFAPYVLEQYAAQPGFHIRQSPSINVLIDDFYARSEWRDALENLRAPVRKALQTQRDRVRRKADVLQQEMDNAEDAQQFRQQAELLLAYQHDIAQGQSSVTLNNFFAGDDHPSEVTVLLDPRYDAVGNANRLFNRYHKLRRAATLVPEQIAQNATELATIEQLLTDLMLAETPAEVNLVKAEVQAVGYMRGQPQAQQKKAQKSAKKGGKQAKGKPTPPGGGVPLHIQSHDGFTLLVGKNSRQNEEVTFHQAAPNDIWLHARGVPGAHVIIKAAGRDIPRSTIDQAAALAAYYSQGRGSTSVPVDYTLQRHVHHMKNGGPGMVTYEREKTVFATPEA
jgi:predicted ribosome quality control (RQC) complex YloA/Tae2 family protein